MRKRGQLQAFLAEVVVSAAVSLAGFLAGEYATRRWVEWRARRRALVGGEWRL